MKTTFAKEKSEYARCLKNCINDHLSDLTRLSNITRIKELEQIIKDQDDKIIFIVTTEKTNPFPEKCADPMAELLGERKE